MVNPEVKLSPRRRLVVNCLTDKFGLKFPVTDDRLVPPPAKVAKILGLPREYVGGVYHDFRQPSRNILPLANPENSRKRAAKSISESRGGLWLAIKRYAPFMTAREICLLLADQLGEEEMKDRNFHKANIGRVIVQHRKRHDLAGRTLEEKETTKFVRSESEERIIGRARFWSDVIDVLESQGIKPSGNRVIWMDVWQRARDVNDGVRLTRERLAEGQKLHSILQNLLERKVIANSFWEYFKSNFVTEDDKTNEKRLEQHEDIIIRIDSMSLSLAEKEKLFRCLFWEKMGGKKYAEFFGVPNEELLKHLNRMLDGDDLEDLRNQYDNLYPET